MQGPEGLRALYDVALISERVSGLSFCVARRSQFQVLAMLQCTKLVAANRQVQL